MSSNSNPFSGDGFDYRNLALFAASASSRANIGLPLQGQATGVSGVFKTNSPDPSPAPTMDSGSESFVLDRSFNNATGYGDDHGLEASNRMSTIDLDVPMTFPQRLMEILSDEANSEIISWLSHGRGFMIYQKRRFAAELLPKYFKKSKFTSFTRKLNRWCFTRITRGPEAGAYYHEFFQRGNHRLCMQMCCHSGKSPSFGATMPTWNVAQAPMNPSPVSGLNNFSLSGDSLQLGSSLSQAPSIDLLGLQNLQQQHQQQQERQRQQLENAQVLRLAMALAARQPSQMSLQSALSLNNNALCAAPQANSFSPATLYAAINALRQNNQNAYISALKEKLVAVAAASASSSSGVQVAPTDSVSAQTSAVLQQLAEQRMQEAASLLQRSMAIQQGSTAASAQIPLLGRQQPPSNSHRNSPRGAKRASAA